VLLAVQGRVAPTMVKVVTARPDVIYPVSDISTEGAGVLGFWKLKTNAVSCVAPVGRLTPKF
jgi:hypothetical protein